MDRYSMAVDEFDFYQNSAQFDEKIFWFNLSDLTTSPRELKAWQGSVCDSHSPQFWKVNYVETIVWKLSCFGRTVIEPVFRRCVLPCVANVGMLRYFTPGFGALLSTGVNGELEMPSSSHWGKYPRYSTMCAKKSKSTGKITVVLFMAYPSTIWIYIFCGTLVKLTET